MHFWKHHKYKQGYKKTSYTLGVSVNMLVPMEGKVVPNYPLIGGPPTDQHKKLLNGGLTLNPG